MAAGTLLVPPPSSAPENVEAEELSALIGTIYDAALDHALWPMVLERVARFADGAAAGLLSKDSVSKAGAVHHNFGVSEHYLQLYRETYWRFDPLTPLLFAEVGEVTQGSDYIDETEFRESRFYREWISPQGWVDAANVVLERSSASFSLLSVIRDGNQGPVDARMRRRLDLMTPHLRRAVLIGKVVDLESGRAAAFADTLDSVAAAVFLLDADGCLLHANRAGQAMLAAGDPLRSAGGAVLARDKAAGQHLRDALAAACLSDAALGDKGIAVPLTSGAGDHFVAHMLPMSGRTQRGATAGGDRVAAAMFVQRAAFDAPTAPQLLSRTFGLTPGELRVLTAIVDFCSVSEAAEALGVGEATVKTHLHRLFAKTDTRRQSDLVKLVAGWSSPLAR